VIGGTVLHLLLAGALTVELVIEGERLLLGGEVDVAGTAPAAAEPGAGLREAGLEERRRTGGRSGVAGLGGLEGIAGAASAGVDVVAGGGVRFGDGVVGWHWRGGERRGVEDGCRREEVKRCEMTVEEQAGWQAGWLSMDGRNGSEREREGEKEREGERERELTPVMGLMDG
jgi:hypothetical protein